MAPDFFFSPYFLLFARFTIAGVLILAAVGKLLDPAGSQQELAKASFVPAPLAQPLATALPFVELLLGGLLLLGLGLAPVGFAAAVLLLLFSTVVALDLLHNKRKPCHCFGRFSSEPLGVFTMLRDLFLLALALLVALRPTTFVALDAAFGASDASLPAPVNAVPVAFLALITVLLIVLGGAMAATVRGFLRAF